MAISRDDAKAMIAELLPKVEKESAFLGPFTSMNIGATSVFDAIRKRCDPPMSEDEFNGIADGIEGK